MVLFFSLLALAVLACLTMLPSVRLSYARNPPLAGLLLTVVSSFIGVYAALVFSRSEDRRDRMARAATLIEMTRESLSADKMEARILGQMRESEWLSDDAAEGGARAVSAQPKELSDLLANGAVLEEISPVSLKALLGCQAIMEGRLKGLLEAKGRDRRVRLNAYLRELAFTQGVLAAEAEFQRGNIGRSDLEEILGTWARRRGAASI